MTSLNKVSEIDYNNAVNRIKEFYRDYKDIDFHDREPFFIKLDKVAYGYMLKVKFDVYLFTFHYYSDKSGNYYLGGTEYDIQDNRGWYTAMMSCFQKFDINPSEFVEYLDYLESEIREAYKHHFPNVII